MKLTKKLLKELGWSWDSKDKCFYPADGGYIYDCDILRKDLKEFFDAEKRSEYKKGYLQAQTDIRKALGIIP